jgi:diguanylate cyclase (GGDEF)-like protein
MAYLDELTEIPGRRALREEMLKLSGTYSMAMVDIDYFKKFNDKYGHDVGDDVLRLVASKIKLVSGGGRAFRYGGEEFALIFSGKTLEEMLPHLEILRDTISQAKFTPRDKGRPKKKPERITKSNSNTKKLSVTVSIGAAEKNTAIKTAQDVLTAADKALYRAKKNGRNRVSK